MKLTNLQKFKQSFKSQEGASLVELIAAIAILAIIVISFLTFFIQSAKTTHFSETVMDATYLAQQEMEYVYHLSETKNKDEAFSELTIEYGSPSVEDSVITYTFTKEEIEFVLTLKEDSTIGSTVLFQSLLTGSKEGKEQIKLESKVAFEGGETT